MTGIFKTQMGEWEKVVFLCCFRESPGEIGRVGSSARGTYLFMACRAEARNLESNLQEVFNS